MSRHTREILASSKSPAWRTPAWLVAALQREFTLVLDAAADPSNAIVPHFLGPGSDLLDDALCGVPWWDVVQTVLLGELPTACGAIFCNPPYSRDEGIEITPWVRAMGLAGRDGTVIGVLPYSPQTEWWRTYVQGHTDDATGDPGTQASEIRQFPFRVKFDPPPGYVGKASGANVNTAVVLWRPSDDFLAPWTPQQRYWRPREYHAARRRSVEAVRGARAAAATDA